MGLGYKQGYTMAKVKKVKAKKIKEVVEVKEVPSAESTIVRRGAPSKRGK